MFMHDAILSPSEKPIVHRAMCLYIQDLQRQFYRDKTITAKHYEDEMANISNIVEKLKVTYRHDNSYPFI
jgi:hypothetical protein